MTKISPINSLPRSAGIQPTISSGATPQAGPINFKEKFNFTDIKLDEREKGDIASEERLNYLVMVHLFVEILQSGVDIVPQPPRGNGRYIVEASFRSPQNKDQRPKILAPLRGVSEPLAAPAQTSLNNKSFIQMVKEYVSIIIYNSTDADIIRLLIVIAHEFGHYQSFIRGHHDKELKYGIYLLHSGQVSGGAGKFTWLVFREEVAAWKFAYDSLKRCGFRFFSEFEKVKIESLQTYFGLLNLEKAELDIYFKLSMLGDDFIKSATSKLFDAQKQA